MRVGVVQMNSGADVQENLVKMRGFAERLIKNGAQIIAFPEMAYLSSGFEVWEKALLQYDDLKNRFSHWAKDLGIFLSPGTLREPSGNGRYFNTLLIFGPDGKEVSKYQKLFRFKADIPEKKYDETRYCDAGQKIVVTSTPLGKLGCAICFDLRFPELFRSLKQKGAQVVLLPSSFTAFTGKAHWMTLLKARAIENQFFVIAPAQTGRIGEGGETFGHSAVISPWGEVMALQESGESGLCVDIDLSEIAKAQSLVPSWTCQRDDLFPIR